MLHTSRLHRKTPLHVVRSKRPARHRYLYLILCKFRLDLASWQLKLVARCHKHLSEMIDFVYPPLPGVEDLSSPNGSQLNEWTPTTQPVFAVVPPNHIIRGPGETRKLHL